MKIWKPLAAGWAVLSLDCRGAARAQSDALEAPLSPSRRVALWLHLRLCKWCRRYGRQVRFLRSAAHDHGEQLTGAQAETLPADVRARIKTRLQQERERP